MIDKSRNGTNSLQTTLEKLELILRIYEDFFAMRIWLVQRQVFCELILQSEAGVGSRPIELA